MLIDRQIPLEKDDSEPFEDQLVTVQLGPTGRLRGSHCKVMICLLGYASEDGLASVSLDELANNIPMHKSSVRRALAQMTAIGHLSVLYSQGRRCYLLAPQFIRPARCEEPDPRQLEFLYLLRHRTRLSTADTPLRLRVLEKGWSRCWYCGSPLDQDDFHVDHIVPRTTGGSNNYANLAPACQICNTSKGASTLEEFRTKIQRLSGNPARHLFFFERDRVIGGGDA